MRIGLVSDVHGNRPALAAVLEHLRAESDMLLFAGDLTGYYPFVADCARMLIAAGAVGVLGNHDSLFRELLRGNGPAPADYVQRYGTALGRGVEDVKNDRDVRSWVEQLPVKRVIEVDRRRIEMVHGAPWDPLEGRVYPDFDAWERFEGMDADVVVLGHTHYVMQKRVAGRLVVNPGSVGQARDRRGRAACAVLDTATLEVEEYRISFDRQELLADAKTHDPHLSYLTEVLTPT